MTYPVLVMATRGKRPNLDAEPVMVERHGDVLTLTLDDGDVLEFSATELGAASSVRLTPLREVA